MDGGQRDEQVLVVWCDKTTAIVEQYRRTEHRLRHLVGDCMCDGGRDTSNQNASVENRRYTQYAGYEGIFDEDVQERLLAQNPDVRSTSRQKANKTRTCCARCRSIRDSVSRPSITVGKRKTSAAPPSEVDSRTKGWWVSAVLAPDVAGHFRDPRAFFTDHRCGGGEMACNGRQYKGGRRWPFNCNSRGKTPIATQP